MFNKAVLLMLLPISALATECETITYQRVERSASMSVKKAVVKKPVVGKPKTVQHYRPKVHQPTYKRIATRYDCSPIVTRPIPPGAIRIGGTFFHGTPLIWGVPPSGFESAPYAHPSAVNFTPTAITGRRPTPASVQPMWPDKPEPPKVSDNPTHLLPPDNPNHPLPPVEPPPTSVPEPAPLPLLLLGLVLLIANRWNNKRKP
jgi:hypothetical protein